MDVIWRPAWQRNQSHIHLSYCGSTLKQDCLHQEGVYRLQNGGVQSMLV